MAGCCRRFARWRDDELKGRNVTTTDHTPSAANALHAAGVWLERIEAPAGTLVCITIWPAVSLGTWAPGLEHVAVLETLGDPEGEVLEAAAPLIQALMAQCTPEAVAIATQAALGGIGRLRLLLDVARATAVLRLERPGHGQAVLAAVTLEAEQPLH